MKQPSSVFGLSIRDRYHQPSLCQRQTAIISISSPSMTPLIKSLSSAFPLSTRDSYHRFSPCQNEIAIISLPSVNDRQLSSASLRQRETDIISLSSVNIRQLSSAFPLSTREGYHQSFPCQHKTAIMSSPC
jgi:hypothetical protein